MDVLERIYQRSKEDVAKRKRQIAGSEFQSMQGWGRNRSSLYSALKRQGDDTVRILAEIKKASPSQGVIRIDFDPERLAIDYVDNGAAAISVLTDEPFFQGDLHYLENVSQIVNVPVLRKDFIHDIYQLEEARGYGADAVLLIVTMLDRIQLRDLHQGAEALGLECLVECYDERDFDSIDFDLVRILGVNNRDLRTFNVDVHRGISILKKAPISVVTVSESGLKSPADMFLLHENNIDAALIGEHFMRQASAGSALKELINY
jgi:indole-3-glycerol phosphate synthase